MPADRIIPGDVLWSSVTERELVVIARARVPVDASGNLYRDPEQADSNGGAKVYAIVLSVRNPDGSTQRLGAFAPSTRLQVYR